MDLALFDSTITPLQPVLLARARTLTRDPDDAQDLVQIAMMKAWKAFERFDGEYPKAWMFMILKNCFINDWRARKARPTPAHYDGFQFAEMLEDARDGYLFRHSGGTCSAPNAEDVALAEMLDPAIQKALQRIPETFARAVLLCDVHGYHYAEIAEMLDIPIGTVMSRIHRGRKALREILKDSSESGMNPSESVFN